MDVARWSALDASSASNGPRSILTRCWATRLGSGAAVRWLDARGSSVPPSAARSLSDRADELSVYGVGWEEFIDVGRISGEFLDNDQLPAAYAGAGIVLNDHHPEMATDGFLSNRLDAVATGAVW